MLRSNLRRIRVIPTLLLDRAGQLVKTVKFKKRTYIGDPINAVKIFNHKEVDELILLDIDASRDGREPNYARIRDIVSEAFMPVAYGGGIETLEQVVQLYRCGVDKVVLSSCLSDRMQLVSEVAARFGSQAVIACLPVQKNLFGKPTVRLQSGRRDTREHVAGFARRVVSMGAGELIVYAIERDGTYLGYDLELLKHVSEAVDVPVVACGGARGFDDFRSAVIDAQCSAVAAGSLFVYQSKGRGVLITYPTQEAMTERLFKPVVE